MKKNSIIIVIVLLFFTCIASIFYLRSRNDAPKGNLAVVSGDKTVLIDPFGSSLVPVKGVTINAKGQEKKLANHPEINRTVKTLNRWISKEEIPIELLDSIGHVLNVDPNYISGG